VGGAAGPELTVVVATRDRPAQLRGCLEALVRQRVQPGVMEVLVVDDGSTSELAPVVGEVASVAPFPIRLVRQAPGGLSRARNRGAAEARGRVVAYLDDDARADPSWARAVVEAFEHGAWEAVAGRIVLGCASPPPRWLDHPGLRAYLGELDLGEVPGELPPERDPVGANCAVSRVALLRLGGFSTSLGRVGPSLRSNEERELFRRLRRAGGRVGYAPGALVVHIVGPERLTLPWFRARARAQGSSDVVLEPPGTPRVLAVLRELVRAARSGPILAKGLVSGQGAVAARLWLDYCAGRLDALLGREEGSEAAAQGLP
jgi:GT2 family glycosyltransferase